MKNKKLIVDLSLHKKIGMKILTKNQIKNRIKLKIKDKFSDDELFNPEGITFKKACEVMKLFKMPE